MSTVETRPLRPRVLEQARAVLQTYLRLLGIQDFWRNRYGPQAWFWKPSLDGGRPPMRPEAAFHIHSDPEMSPLGEAWGAISGFGDLCKSNVGICHMH